MLVQFDPDEPNYAYTLNVRGRISGLDLYDVFRAYEDRGFPGPVKTSKSDWDREMKRLRKNQPASMVFDKHREPTGVHHAYRVLGRKDQGSVDQTSRLEALDHLLVTNSAVLLRLIEVEELSPGGGHVLVGRKNRNKRAKRECPTDDEITADAVEEEWYKRVHEVVEELHKELTLKDLEPDVVDA